MSPGPGPRRCLKVRLSRARWAQTWVRSCQVTTGTGTRTKPTRCCDHLISYPTHIQIQYSNRYNNCQLDLMEVWFFLSIGGGWYNRQQWYSQCTVYSTVLCCCLSAVSPMISRVSSVPVNVISWVQLVVVIFWKYFSVSDDVIPWGMRMEKKWHLTFLCDSASYLQGMIN